MRNIILNTILCFLAAFTLASCGGNPSASEEQLITVDVTKRYPTKEFLLQDLFDIEYVPLETTDEFVCRGRVMDIGPRTILLGNLREGDLLLFDRASGKGVRKINQKGEGPEEYLLTVNSFIDEANQELYVSDGPRNTMLVYSLDGEFKRSFKNKEGAVVTNIYDYDQGHFLCEDTYTPGLTTSKHTFFTLSKQDGSIEEIEIPYEERISTYITQNVDGMVYSATPSNWHAICHEGGWLLMEPSSDTIYTLQADLTLQPFLARTPSVRTMDPVVFLFPCVLADRYCFMEAVELAWDFEKEEGLVEKDLVYDREEGKIYECVLRNPDFEGQEIDLPDNVFDSESAFCIAMDPIDLIDAHAAGKLSGRLAEIASTLHEEDNPVIMIAKYKK